MKSIKDPVHGYIQVDSELLPLLDSPEVQRLRYIRQLGFSFLVYPGAHHTRFEHSLGTMHLAKVLSKQLDLTSDDQRLVTVSALLHDAGHGPYSHAIEGLAIEILGRHHTDINTLLKGGCIGPALKKLEIEPDEVSDIVNGKHHLSGTIHGDLDVDRMDYLLRDAHYTGVPYGTVDAMRLIRAMRFSDENIVLDESGVQAAESLLIARTLMRPAVYYHHVSRIAEKMFILAVSEFIRPDPPSLLEDVLLQDDAGCMQSLLYARDQKVVSLVSDLYRRHLYKRVLYIGKEYVSESYRNNTESLLKERILAKEISEEAGLDHMDVLVDIPQYPHDIWMDVKVQNRNGIMPLEMVSPLVKTLNETRRSQWRLGVYAPAGVADLVYQAARSVLGIRPFTRQEQLL